MSLTLSSVSIELPERLLLTDLSFTVDPGMLWQIAGANGAGKTTLLRAMTGLKPISSGMVAWNGRNIQEQLSQYWSQIQYLGHKTAIKPKLTVRENMLLNSGVVTTHQRVQEVLDILGLKPQADQFAGLCSAGQQRRLSLARLWLRPSQLWILDEPYTALDQYHVSLLTAWIEDQVLGGGSVLMTSHRELPMNRIPIHRIDLSSPQALSLTRGEPAECQA